VISAELLMALRDLRLCERALDGDVEAGIEWLTKHGGPEWQVREADPERNDPAS
jgi:hypothetical protein